MATGKSRSLPRQLNCLLPGTAERVRLIVSETFGGGWEGFQGYICEPLPAHCGGHEYRFGGALGSGGKLHLSMGQLYVSCYREDETPILRAAMSHINYRLAVVLEERDRAAA